ncbi:MAG: MBL fold metallo-hydrolase [Clostridium sp.]|nr:MBL fold metallo-hydrolase [Clostridium sp.]
MKIQWFGNSTFLLTNELGKKILLDPFNIFRTLNENITADISTFSKPIDFSTTKNLKHFGKIINTACSCNIENIKVNGYECKSDLINGLKRGPNIIYLFEMDKLKICHLGYLGEFINNELINILNNSDILFIPIGGNVCLNGMYAYLLSKKLNAKYIIPMCYRNNHNNFYFNGPKDFLSCSKNVVSIKTDALYLSDLYNNKLPSTILMHNIS